jgi:hypothetical protein
LSVFSGLAALQVALPSRITQSTSDWLILFEPTLSIVDGAKVKRLADGCQCRFSVQTVNTLALLLETLNRLITCGLLHVKMTKTLFRTRIPQSPVAWFQFAVPSRYFVWRINPMICVGYPNARRICFEVRAPSLLATKSHPQTEI